MWGAEVGYGDKVSGVGTRLHFSALSLKNKPDNVVSLPRQRHVQEPEIPIWSQMLVCASCIGPVVTIVEATVSAYGKSDKILSHSDMFSEKSSNKLLELIGLLFASITINR